jgi:hypothetical protein
VPASRSCPLMRLRPTVVPHQEYRKIKRPFPLPAAPTLSSTPRHWDAPSAPAVAPGPGSAGRLAWDSKRWGCGGLSNAEEGGLRQTRNAKGARVVLLAVRLPLLSGVVEEEYSLTVERRPDTYLAEISTFLPSKKVCLALIMASAAWSNQHATATLETLVWYSINIA